MCSTKKAQKQSRKYITVKRPMPYLLIFLCIGIYAANAANSLQRLAVLSAAVLIACLFCAFFTDRIYTALFPLMVFAGIFLFKAFLGDPMTDVLIDRAAAARESAAVSGVVTDLSPKDGKTAYKIKTDLIALEDGTKITSPCGVRLITPQKLSCGERVVIISRIYMHYGKFNPSDFDNRLYLRTQGISYSMYTDSGADIRRVGRENSPIYAARNLMYGVRCKVSGVFDKNFTPAQAGLLKAVTTGDRSGLDYDIKQNFKGSGIYHFLAISGLHLSAAAAFIMLLLGRADKRAACVITAVLLGLYWIMTGAGVAVTRAVLMIYILLAGRVIYRRYDLINAASLAALILLVCDPLYLFDTGFLYSFGAVFGIALVVPHVTKRFSKGVVGYIACAAAVSFGATLFTRVITLARFYTVNKYDILINVALMPLMIVIVIGAAVYGFAGLIFDVGPAARPLGFMADMLLAVTDRLGRVCVVPVGCPSKTALGLILAGLLVFVLFLLRPCAKRLALSVLLLFSAVPMLLTYNKEPVLNFLYVGQGDCCVINKGRRANIIDCGGSALSDIGADTGTYRIMPFLDYSGVRSVGAVFVSHMDTDHVKGLFDLMKGGTDIDRIYISAYADENENHALLLDMAAERGIPVMRLSAGEKVTLDGMDISCLYPSGHISDKNDNSMVLKWEYGGKSALFTGDISKKAEKTLPKEVLDTDILKLAHHGSRTSTSVYLVKNASPEFAVASAGLNNTFGHPSKEIVARMRKYGVKLYKTYDEMTAFVYKDGNFTVYRYENLEYNSIVR